MERTIKTVIHHYHFDVFKPEQKKEWEELCKKLAFMDDKKFHAHGGKNGYQESRNGSFPIELDTKFLFDNQWNTTDGKRVFDWYQEYTFDNKMKRGHWLEQTKEMQEIRNNTYKCGYCGKYSNKEDIFCRKCLGSEYLKENDFQLLRLSPVNFKNNLPELTQKEKDFLLPLYNEAQGLGKQEREKAFLSKNRKKIATFLPEAQEKAEELINEAKRKTEAFTWLMDNYYNNLNNVIYYTHTKRFCFGWYKPLSKEEKEKMYVLLEEFPFDYDLK